MDNETLIIVFITATIIATGITVDKAIDNKKTYKKKKNLFYGFGSLLLLVMSLSCFITGSKDGFDRYTSIWGPIFLCGGLYGIITYYKSGNK